MKLVALRFAAVSTIALLATVTLPALAAPEDDYDSGTTVVTTTPAYGGQSGTTVVTTAPPANVQSTDQAREDYYQNKLEAAQAEARANQATAKADQALAERDQALADRDAAQTRAYNDQVARDQDQSSEYP